MPHNCLSKTVQEYLLLSYFVLRGLGVGPFPLLMFLCRVSFLLKQISLHFLYWLFAHLASEACALFCLKFFFFSNISAVVQIPILPRVRLAWLKSEVFLVLYYTPRLTITVRGLVVACTTGSISNPYNPTYWARLQSPVNYQTGVSFCPSSTNPLSAPLSYWAVVCPET